MTTPVAIDADLLDELDDVERAAVQSSDPTEAAAAILGVVDTIPPFSSLVRERSRWLSVARQLIVTGVDPGRGLDVRLLAAIAQTAFAARETAPALTASEQALAAAVEIGDVALQLSVMARRLPHLLNDEASAADAEMKRIHDLVAKYGEANVPVGVLAEVMLATAAWLGAHGRYDEQRRALVKLARLALPQDDRLSFIAYATHCALAQLWLRTRQRMHAVQTLIEAARLAAEMDAQAELANLQAVLAAYAVRIGDYDAALAHAESALNASRASTAQHGQPDPWLGMPYDVATEQDCGGIIQVLAEAAVTTLDRGDRTAFLVLATALVAFYMLDDRAPEALDTLNEAIEVTEQGGDERGVEMLRGVSEGLLRYMGMLS